MRLKWFLISVLLLPITKITAQELHENNFNHYTKADGLSNDNVTGIAQDATGYIWTSTWYGLNRYDGSSSVQYHSNDDSLSPAAEDLFGMTWLDKEQLAVYTTGLHIINTKTGERGNLFIPYHDKQYQFKFNMIMKAMGDNSGNVYVLTRSGFYTRYEGN